VNTRIVSCVVRKTWAPTLGAIAVPEGVRFRVWAPAARDVRLLMEPHDGGRQEHRPQRHADGTWEVTIRGARTGDRYAYSLDGHRPLPDPVSRYQPDGVHGWSEVIDPSSFAWSDDEWEGVDPRRVAIYELHVGTFTPEGTFRGAARKLAHLRELGVTAIELMPLADFAGTRNWGYDGVCLFAPAHAYGHPDDLRALIDRAHGEGLAVIIDVVYNHLGPEGAYLPQFAPQFLTTKHKTPWGGAVNLDDEGSDLVRSLLIENALHWIHEYHADGLRLDATHALLDSPDRPFVAELTRAVHGASEPPPLVYAEDSRNLSVMVEETDEAWGLDGVWADDFHHVLRCMLAGDRHGYYEDYKGTASEVAATLTRAWLFVGQHSRYQQAPRGTDPANVPMRKAIVCLENHDQVGNRALGDRLHHSVDAASWRAAVTLLLMAPTTPLLFMGQEWSASSPFLFFTDFEPELGKKVLEGRRSEFRSFPEFATAEAAARIPDPQAEATFLASRLDWTERDARGHAEVLRLHRALLQLRSTNEALLGGDEFHGASDVPDDSTIALYRDDEFVVVARLRGAGTVRLDPLGASAWDVLLTTEDAEFAVDPVPIRYDGDTVTFTRPGAIVFRRA
jgi:maltooligosyltrehalose trehalohydrolase